MDFLKDVGANCIELTVKFSGKEDPKDFLYLAQVPKLRKLWLSNIPMGKFVLPDQLFEHVTFATLEDIKVGVEQISRMPRLKQLTLHRAKIADLLFIGSLNDLIELNLGGCRTSSLSGLENPELKN